MMASYQDLETRVLMLERKMDLVMQVSQVTLQVGSPFDPAPQTIRISLGDFYQELQRAGGMIVNQGNDKELVGRNRIDNEGGVPTEPSVAPFTEAEFRELTPADSVSQPPTPLPDGDDNDPLTDATYAATSSH